MTSNSEIDSLFLFFQIRLFQSYLRYPYYVKINSMQSVKVIKYLQFRTQKIIQIIVIFKEFENLSVQKRNAFDCAFTVDSDKKCQTKNHPTSTIFETNKCLVSISQNFIPHRRSFVSLALFKILTKNICQRPSSSVRAIELKRSTQQV